MLQKLISQYILITVVQKFNSKVREHIYDSKYVLLIQIWYKNVLLIIKWYTYPTSNKH